MALPALYLETTVPSYYVARPSTDIVLSGHQHITREWWDLRRQAYQIFVSELVVQEAERGDAGAAEKRISVISEFSILRVTHEAIDLAGVYLKELPLPPNAQADALHLAVATIHRMDYLLTWNCRHIARGSIMRVLPALNTRLGLDTLTICTPEELLYESS